MTDPEFSEEGRTHGSPGSTIFALGLLAFVAVVAVMVGGGGMTDLQALKTLREKVAAGTAMKGDFRDAGFTRSQANLGVHAMVDTTRALGSAVALLEAVRPGARWVKLRDGQMTVVLPNLMAFSATNENEARALVLATIDALIEEAEG